MKISFQPRQRLSNVEQHQDWNKDLEQVGKNQDRQAFARIFNHFSPLLKSFFMKNGGQNIETAEEIVQETMIKVWKKAEKYDPAQGSASTWIYTIARNSRIDAIRSQVRKNTNLLDADDVYAESFENQALQTPQSTLIRFRERKEVSSYLSELPDEQAEVMRLMYFDGMSGQQVSDMLGLPLGTVKSRIRLALSKMRLNLNQQDFELEGSAGEMK